MEKRWLKEYVYNMAKIERARRKRSALREEQDVVRGSSPDHPYTAHPMRVSGMNASAVDRINAEVEAAVRKCRAVEAFVEGVEDERTRDILRARYIDGDSWEEINEMYSGGGTGKDAPRKLAERYVEKNL